MRVTVIFILLMLIFGQRADARIYDFTTSDPLNAVVGKVVKIRLDINRLYIVEESSGEPVSFFVDDVQLAKFAVGDRVRVYFRSLRLPAVNVVKMTVINDKEKNKNQGYLYRKN